MPHAHPDDRRTADLPGVGRVSYCPHVLFAVQTRHRDSPPDRPWTTRHLLPGDPHAALVAYHALALGPAVAKRFAVCSATGEGDVLLES